MVNKRIYNGKGKLLSALFIMAMILIIFIFSDIHRNQQVMANGSKRKGNMFYIQLVNYTLPAIKVLNFDEENMAESTVSVKSVFLSIIGIDLNEPDKIVKKEMPYFSQDNLTLAYDKNSSKETNFNLNDSDISRDANNSDITNNNSNAQNAVFQVYDPKLKKTLNVTKPEVLIYHSHTTESYSPYGSDNTDPTRDVCAVGDVIANELENNYGIAVIHDTTIHNVAAYTKSYERSGETVDKYLSKYGDFKMVIDLHRDSSPDKSALTMKINDENVAKFMFVMARKNPHYDKNIALVNSIINVSNKDFPGICNGIYYYNYGTNFFNQAKSNNAFLLEVGSDVNTIDEAKATGKYIARILAETLNK